MADTERTLSALQTLLADNTSGAISPQDLRDFLVSAAPRIASYYISSSSATTISVAGTYYKAAGTTAEVQGSSDWTHGTNRMTYTGTPNVTVKVRAMLTSTCASATQVLSFRIAKNANATETAAVATTVNRKIGTGSDEGACGVEGVFTLSTNDYVEVWVTNETSTGAVTLNHGHVTVEAVLS